MSRECQVTGRPVTETMCHANKTKGGSSLIYTIIDFGLRVKIDL